MRHKEEQRLEEASGLFDKSREYNELYAYPITWSWTRQKMHRWVARHAH